MGDFSNDGAPVFELVMGDFSNDRSPVFEPFMGDFSNDRSPVLLVLPFQDPVHKKATEAPKKNQFVDYLSLCYPPLFISDERLCCVLNVCFHE